MFHLVREVIDLHQIHVDVSSLEKTCTNRHPLKHLKTVCLLFETNLSANKPNLWNLTTHSSIGVATQYNKNTSIMNHTDFARQIKQ